MIPNVLSVAGSDPSGGAGIAADLKTFGALGCHGMAALTALTVQNTGGVGDILTIPPAFAAAQIAALFADSTIAAAKVGMLGSPAIAAAVAGELRPSGVPVVVDPVLVATSGHALGSADVAEAILAEFLPFAALLTPNLAEAAALTGMPIAATLADMEATGRTLLARGARAVLVKGGHLAGDTAIDVLCTPDGCQHFAGTRIATRNTHGTGCTLSAAIAAFLAHGLSLADAIGRAKNYLTAALAGADRLRVGRGCGPVDHFHALRVS